MAAARLTYILPAACVEALPALARLAAADTTRFTVDLDRHPGADCPTAPWTGPTTRAQIYTLLCDARDRCCTAKGCSRPPAFCDIHHLRTRADSGTTDLANLTSRKYALAGMAAA